jgi:orotidine-5'-phosphate decarboxylase
LSIVGSNGASQAILDAEALSNAIISHVSDTDSYQKRYDIPAALQAYQDERLTPTAKIVMANRANGPDHVMEVAEQRAPDGFKNVLDVITKEELEDIGRTYKAVAGFEMDKVNKKADDTEGVADKLGLKGPKNMSPSVLY